MSSQRHSQSFEDDCSLSDFDSAGLSLCNVSEMVNFTRNYNLETQTGSIEIVNVTNEGVQSASHPVWKTGISINLRGIEISAEYI